MSALKKSLPLAIALAAILGLQSCHSSKNAVSQDDYPTSRATAEEVSLPSELKSLAQSYSGWNDVQASVKLQIVQPKRTSLSGVAKMIKGECVHVSIRVFGFEVGSLYADKESVQIYIKAMDMYWSENISVLAERYGLTLTDIQSMLLGQAFLPGSGTITAADESKFNVERASEVTVENGTVFTFSPKKQAAGLSWAYTAVALPGAAPRLSSMSISSGSAATINCSFGQTVTAPAGAVTTGIEAGTTLRGKQFQASWNWSMESAKWNTGLSVNKPAVSKSARKVSTEQVLKMLNAL